MKLEMEAETFARPILLIDLVWIYPLLPFHTALTFESVYRSSDCSSPMLRSNVHRVNIHTILEPTLLLADLDVVSTHLSLLHQAVVVKSPILESIASPPLTIIVMEFIPKLHSNLKGGLKWNL
jgi:hypothetical protein